jgi:hypothetical protein
MKPSGPTDSSLRRYGLIILATTLILLGAVAIFNFMVDPFAMYRLVEIQGFNANKPTVFKRLKLLKAFEVRRVKPQTIILGTSRSHVGLRCSHEVWAHLEGPCYNLAFDGATTKEMYAYLLHAQAIRPLRHVLLGLDTYHPTSAKAFTRPDFDPEILARSRAWRWTTLFTGDLRLLTSMDMWRASLKTLQDQKQFAPDCFAPDGQRLGEVYFRHYERTFVRSGPRAYFEEVDRREIGSQKQAQPTPAAAHHDHDLPANPDETSLAYIRRIMAFCRAHHIDLRIFITPCHVHQLEIAAAFWGPETIDNSRRALVGLLAEDAARHPGEPPIPLLDFSGYNSITTEPLPAAGSFTEMRYYWDSSHFKEIVGDYVLDRIYHAASLEPQVPADFGVVLNQATLDSVLEQQHKAELKYHRTFADTDGLARYIREAKQETRAQTYSSASASETAN